LSGALALLGILTLQAVKTYQMQQMETDLASRAKTVNLSLGQMLLTAPATENPEAVLLRVASELIRQVTNERALSTVIYTLSGSAHNGSEALEKPLLDIVASDRILYQIHDQKVSQDAVYVDYLAPLYNGNDIIGILRLKYYYSQYIEFYQSMQRMILITGASVFAFSLLAALWYYGRLTSAILKLRQSVKRVEQGSYDTVEILNRKDELGELSAGIEQMASTIEGTLQKLQAEQTQLTMAVGKLKAMEGEQRKFFGSITHEFKTPLSVINAYNDLTEMYSDDEILQDATRKQIRSEVQKLTAMVEKALEIAKLEKYDFELNINPVHLNTLIEEMVARLRVKANPYDLTWHLDLQPVIFPGDKDMMGQIIMNLLDNAIKYNVHGGQIWIELKKTDNLQLIIENTGEGITDFVKERLFEAFSADDSTSQTHETGTGLGLALVKRLIELQRGRIEIKEGLPERHSDQLKGCRVVIELLSFGDNSETTSL
jgi:signal transduction histidine kinase